MKRRRKTPLTKLKDRLWAVTRRIVFSRHGNDCYTCGARDLTGSNLHCGHYISASVCSPPMKYDLNNLRPQCHRCNIWLRGNWVEYEARLIRDGVDVERLKMRHWEEMNIKCGRDWYEDKITEYEGILNEMV